MRAQFHDVSKTLQGDTVISFRVPDIDLEKIEKLKDKPLDLEIKKHSEKRSLNANAYHWKLCSMIASKLGTDKDTIHEWLIRDTNYFSIIDCREEAVDMIKSRFRYVDEIESYVIETDEGYSWYKQLRIYKGSSEYNTKEMSELVEKTVEDAKSLGIETWSDEELAYTLSMWEGDRYEGYTKNR